MSNTLSAAAVRSLCAQQTDEVFLSLLTIAGTGMSTVRIVANNEAVVSNGETFEPFPFAVVHPADTAEGVPSVNLQACNVDRQLIAALRAIPSTATVKLETVLASSPDTIERTFEFTGKQLQYVAEVVRLDLTYEDILNEPIPCDAITAATVPGNFPG